MKTAVISSLVAACLAFWLGQKVKESFCQKEIIQINQEEIKKNNEVIKTSIKAKKIAIDNNKLERNELIDLLQS